MYALILVFIMVERFAVVEVAGLGAGTQFVKNLGLLTAAKSRNFRKIPPPPPRPPHPFLPGGRQRNLKSRGTLSGTIYVTGRYSAGAHYFSGMGS